VGTYRLKVDTSTPLRPREPEPEWTLAFFTIDAYAARASKLRTPLT
jgi:hypothetical protein